MSGPFDHGTRVKAAAFSPDGERVVSGSWDGTIWIWDTETGGIISTFQGHTRPVTSVAFSVDGRQIISVSSDYVIRLWDAHRQQEADEPTFRDDSILKDGWILGSNNELLFWISPLHRAALWRPGNTCVIGRNATRLDFSHFVHGTSWQYCRQ